ncbi:MAG: AmmeMemoRadiSam system protein B [Bacteroidota bacterium]|nr:AmmeMemoRadiSam system protein B [Candidatus Kapabacteria bacterium]MDW8074679.1 AmmeMemoRadiSam system protein B [Bacteroidota bacterium]MDW8270845.1 AmmeMemoRadiSam system protein B [Bacteroidota bacterium]
MNQSMRPKLRDEVRLVVDEDRGVLTFQDACGYVRQDLEFEIELFPLFELFDGTHTIHDIADRARRLFDGELQLGQLLKFIRWIDEELLLDSPSFWRTKRFLDSPVIEPVCAGSVYPDNPDALHAYLDDILSSTPRQAYPQNGKAAFIPHIDFRVAGMHYAYPFNALRQAEFDLVVHIGTSHYGWQDRFLLTTKDFLTPLGRLETDKELVAALRKETGIPLTHNDIAYQPEHALELHHVFLQHLFPDRRFTVLPVLVTSFHDFVHRAQHPSTDAKFSAFTAALKRVVEQSGRKALILVSGDLAHIGRRFGDQWDAAPMLDQLRSEDYEVLHAIAHGSSVSLFSTIARTKDARRICGFPPAMTFLEAFHPGSGVALDYGQWNDAPTRSAVSFGSVVWFD